MKLNNKLIYGSIVSVLIVIATAPLAGACGTYEAIPVPGIAPQAQPGIIDAWTTNNLSDPFTEVYTFKNNVDTLAFVTEYSHSGGVIPQQKSVSFIPETKTIFTKCVYDWTAYSPPGTYLLINYYPVISVVHSRTLDWAGSVGDSTIGWPDLTNDLRPLPFTVK